jgi:hypothetical protein
MALSSDSRRPSSSATSCRARPRLDISTSNTPPLKRAERTSLPSHRPQAWLVPPVSPDGKPRELGNADGAVCIPRPSEGEQSRALSSRIQAPSAGVGRQNSRAPGTWPCPLSALVVLGEVGRAPVCVRGMSGWRCWWGVRQSVYAECPAGGVGGACASRCTRNVGV